MSAIVVLPILIPAASAAWPAIAAAAAAAASALGYAAARTKRTVQGSVEVELPVEQGAEVSEEVALGEELVFARGGVSVRFLRDTRGRVAVKISGEGKSEAELRALGEKLVAGLAQQYAYHRLMTELKSRNFNVVDEQVEEDGTVRLQVRVFQD